MTVKEIAQQLTQLCEAGNFNEAYNTLFAKNAKSIEPDGTTANRLAAILQKSEGFKTDVKFVSCTFGQPQFAGNYFSIVQTFSSLILATGEKMKMQEIGLYKVADGMIIEERFFY